MWADDAQWQVGPDQVLRGLEEITAGLRRQWEWFPRMQHATANHRIWVSGETATGLADVVVHTQLADGSWVTGGGSYRDDYVRLDGVWRIQRREATDTFLTGPLVVATPAEGEP